MVLINNTDKEIIMQYGDKYVLPPRSKIHVSRIIAVAFKARFPNVDIQEEDAINTQIINKQSIENANVDDAIFDTSLPILKRRGRPPKKLTEGVEA